MADTIQNTHIMFIHTNQSAYTPPTIALWEMNEVKQAQIFEPKLNMSNNTAFFFKKDRFSLDTYSLITNDWKPANSPETEMNVEKYSFNTFGFSS